MACDNRTARHHSNGYVLFSDAYWQLKKAHLESSHSLVGRVNTLAERTVVSPEPQQWQLTTGAGRSCWGGLVGTYGCLRSLCQQCDQYRCNLCCDQTKCCFRLTHLTEVERLDKRVQNVKADLL